MLKLENFPLGAFPIRCLSEEKFSRKLWGFIPWFSRIEKCNGLLQISNADYYIFKRITIECVFCGQVALQYDLQPPYPRINIGDINDEIRKMWGAYVK